MMAVIKLVFREGELVGHIRLDLRLEGTVSEDKEQKL